MDFKIEDEIFRCCEQGMDLKQIKQTVGTSDTALILSVMNDYNNSVIGYEPQPTPGCTIDLDKTIHIKTYEPVANEGSELD